MSSPRSTGGPATRSSVRRRKQTSPTPSQSSSSTGDVQKVKTALDASSQRHSYEKFGSPVHVAQDSLFSSSSGWTNYTGFFNLAILLLVVSNGRVALENLIKYGILISPLSWVSLDPPTPSHYPNLTIVACSNVTILLALFIERILAKKWLSNRAAVVIYVVLLVLHVSVPAVVTLYVQANPLYSSWALSVIVMETLKLVSYVHVNYWCRSARDSGIKLQEDDEKAVSYPNNLTLTNLYYFMMAPTLCYELKFPRTPGRRKSFLFKRAIELISFSFVCIALCQQWVIPLVKNSVAPFSEMDLKRCLERVLKLAIPNHLIWLMFFYTYFHSAMNLLAELLRFADREFYLDFWNAETITYFWKTWNIPVHRWAVRHLYKPMVRNGFTKFSAAVAVFSVSAFFHEYLVSVPLHMFRLWAFYGMLGQIPLSMLTDKVLKGGRAGNIVVWLSLILGQPMAILMYVHDWYLLNYPDHERLPINATASIPHI